MKIALCYESVRPERGGAETYIADLMRRLAADGHGLDLYASDWDARTLPASTTFHSVPAPRGPRWLRPWRFGRACLKELARGRHDVSLGFNKTWGQDILYPQGGLHAASSDHNVRKYSTQPMRALAAAARRLDLAHWSYTFLERRQYQSGKRPLIIVNSEMVRAHFGYYYGIPPRDIRVVHSAIDPKRLVDEDRLTQRAAWRERWSLAPDDVVGLFIGINYRLKGLEPLLRALRHVKSPPFKLLIAGAANYRPWERLANRLGISSQVRFAGHVSPSRYGFFASDFLIHPTFYDPCSLVVLEAQAAGLPVITSRYNGAQELLTPPHDGYVVDNPHDALHLAWCIDQLCDPLRRAGCAQTSRRKAAQWTFEHHYRALVAILHESVGQLAAA
jgi:UDP-glucose:(heptosyl)LPS alpha-1,3-glucosyltransferase